MNVFQLHKSIADSYANYIKSFIEIKDSRIRDHVTAELNSGRLWPDPLIQFNPAYAVGGEVDQLCDSGMLHSEMRHIFKGRTLYQHQVEALQLGTTGSDFIVTSGTGSGKSLTYVGTIFHRILSAPSLQPGIKAVIVYPMNALINSQTLEIEGYKKLYEESTGKTFPISFAKYTGQEKPEEKEAVVKDPPDILLTNYMMLELLLTRVAEESLRNSIMKSLEVLVFDELHTYRGRQGSDVAILIRRIKAIAEKPVLCIGTSATMISGTSLKEQKSKVAEFGTTIFGKPLSVFQIVSESLVRSFSGNVPSREELRIGLGPIDNTGSLDSLKSNYLAIWLESEIALEEKDGRLVRRKPMTFAGIAERLSEASGMKLGHCETQLQVVLEWCERINKDSGSPHKAILPFKVHQFIAQTGSVFVTLEPSGTRTITLDPSAYIVTDQDKTVPIYPTVFSRISGHEFICVTKNYHTMKLDPRDFRERFAKEDEENKSDGYVIIEHEQPIWNSSDIEYLPDAWLKYKKDDSVEISKEYRDRIPSQVFFNEDGSFAEEQDTQFKYRGWFMPVPLLLDPTSGMFFDPKTSETFKLMRLGNEGRSTATTVISFSIIRGLSDYDLPSYAQKLLSFTDNRQDAALQAGHFNDFVRVGQLRTGIHQALRNASKKELDFSTISAAVFEALGLEQSEYAAKPSTFPGPKKGNEDAFKDYLMYRVLYDLRRGWRVVLPNLEQCALLDVDYKYLGEVSGQDEHWNDIDILKSQSKEQRRDFIRQILDFFRSSYALCYSNLEPNIVDQKTRIIKEKLKYPWTLDKNEKIEAPYYLRVEPVNKRGNNIYTSSIGPTSSFGKFLKSVAKEYLLDLSSSNYAHYVHRLLDRLSSAGYVESRRIKVTPSEEIQVYQLKIDQILWRLGDGKTVRADSVRNRSYKLPTPRANPFFQDFYVQNVEKLKSLFGAEHTAQLDSDKRIDREDRFRSGEIRALYCSPTMELGIDIRELNAVHMRNVPPNPANYAQRSGRAGRSGQTALIFTYCSNYSPHDKHYFVHSSDMVYGAVSAPKIDLTNPELLLSHLNALFLSEVGIGSLERSIAELVDESDITNLPLKSEVKEKLNLSREGKEKVRRTFEKAIADMSPQLSQSNRWFSDDWIRQNIEQSPQRFNESLGRWRKLYQSAHNQILRAQDIVNSPIWGAASNEKRDAIREQRIGLHQKELLRNETGRRSSQLSEFYPFRYLASEGFLPGYNFTRLPLRTFVETEEGGAYISRPRFVALREFGPQNIVYHNGAKYRIKQLVVSDAENALKKAKVAKSSGYILMGNDYNFEVCPFTQVKLNTDSTRELYHDLLEMSETRTEEVDRISCEEEERASTGFDIKTFFNLTGSMHDIRSLHLSSDNELLLKVQYLQAASLVQINDKWRSSKEKGFMMGLTTGLWKREKVNKKDEEQSKEVNRRIRLFTTDTADALYIQPIEVLGLKQEGIVTLQYALKRAIENVFQIESRELGVVSMGETDQPNIFVYEAAQGSLGVLSQLVADKAKLDEVLREAYAICYFKDGQDLHPEIGPATYDDLLSYYNQRDHKVINRRLIKEALEKLMVCDGAIVTNSLYEDYDLQYKKLESERDPNSDTEEKFLKYLYENKFRLPDNAQYRIEGYYVQPDFFYKHNVCVFCDGKPHDDPKVAADDTKKRDALHQAGFQVLSWYYKQSLDQFVDARPDVFFKVK